MPIEVEMHFIASRNIKTSRRNKFKTHMPNSCLILSTPLIMNFGIKRERERVLIICCAFTLIKTSAIPKKSGNENKIDMVKNRFDY